MLREALFNIIGPAIQGARFLDLCAGSGAVGLEALSRGAAHATFVESHPAALAVIRHNLEALGARDRATLLRRDAALAPDELARHAALVRNPDYHGRTAGNVSRVELALVDQSKPDKRLDSYEANMCDICGVDSPEIDEQARQKHAKEHIMATLAYTKFVYFYGHRPPFDDLRVRQAFVHALDRVTMTNTLFGNYRTPATGGFVPPGLPGHSAGIGLPYDPERARQLLAEAGYADGHGLPTLEAWNPSTSEMPPYIRYIKQKWRDVLGVDIHWTFMDWDDWQELLLIICKY